MDYLGLVLGDFLNGLLTRDVGPDATRPKPCPEVCCSKAEANKLSFIFSYFRYPYFWNFRTKTFFQDDVRNFCFEFFEILFFLFRDNITYSSRYVRYSLGFILTRAQVPPFGGLRRLISAARGELESRAIVLMGKKSRDESL